MDTSFEFYIVTLNKRTYILGIEHMSYNSIIKIRLNILGTIEDMIDTVLSCGEIKRVVGSISMIFEGNTLVSPWKDYKLPSLKLCKVHTESYAIENTNISVIDLETFQYYDETYRVYACWFKTYLHKDVNMFYAESPDTSDDVVFNMINELLRNKYNKTTICCHNLGGYDIVFLLKIIVNYNKKKILMISMA